MQKASGPSEDQSGKRRPFLSSVAWSLSCLMLLCVLASFACSSHVHYEQARELGESVDALLITEKLCKDYATCPGKQHFFIKPATVVTVYVYGINDKSIAKKIVALCMDAHAKYPGIQYELFMYRETKDQSLNSVFTRDTVLLELTLKKDE